MNNLFLFTGENSLELQEKLNLRKSEYMKKHSDMNLDIFEEVSENSVPRILTALETAPFLADERMVIIHGVPPPTTPPKNKDEQEGAESEESESSTKRIAEAFEEFLDQIPETTLAIFVSPKPDKRLRLFKAIIKKARIEEFPLPKGGELVSWAQERFHRMHKGISSRALEMLVFYCGGDMNVMAQEIEKLSLLGSPQIDETMIKKFVTPNPEAKIFQVLDLIGNVPQERLLKEFYHFFRSGEPVMMVFFMIVRQVRLLLQFRYLKEKGASKDAGRRLKLAPFQIPGLSRQADRFSMEQLRKAYGQLADLDLQMKTGKIPYASGSEELLMLRIEQFLCSLYE